MNRKIKTIEERIEAVENADTDDFVELARIAKLTPSKSFRHKDLSGIDFSNCDLEGYDFTGSKLEGAKFKGAKFANAIFDKEQLQLSELRNPKKKHHSLSSKISFLDFLRIVKVNYVGNNNNLKKELYKRIIHSRLNIKEFCDFLDEAKIIVQKTTAENGASYKWSGDGSYLVKNFRRGNGSATKAAAFHYLFLCDPKYARYAGELNRLIFGETSIKELFDNSEFPINVIAEMNSPKANIYDNTQITSINELVAAGLKTDNGDGNGIPLGAIDDQMLFYHGNGHLSFRASSRGGKTESSLIPTLLALGKHRNIITTVSSKETACLIADHRQKLGQEVRIIDIHNSMSGTSFETAHFNPIAYLVKLASENNPILIDEAQKIALFLLIEPKNSKRNAFFRYEARHWLSCILVGVAIIEATTGKKYCNLPYIHMQTNVGEDQLRLFLLELISVGDFKGIGKGVAQQILDNMDNARGEFFAVLGIVNSVLKPYDPASHLGDISIYSDFNPYNIKCKPMTIIIVIDPLMSNTHGPAAGLCLEVLINIALQANSLNPRVSVLCDEFSNVSNGELPSIISTLYTGQSLGVQLFTYVQGVEDYKMLYGKKSHAFSSNAEVIIVYNCYNKMEAREYSKHSKELYLKHYTKNVKDKTNDGYHITDFIQKPTSQFSSDHFLHSSDFKATLFYKHLPPAMIDLVSYRQSQP